MEGLFADAFLTAYLDDGFTGPFSLPKDKDLLFGGVSFCFQYLGPF